MSPHLLWPCPRRRRTSSDRAAAVVAPLRTVPPPPPLGAALTAAPPPRCLTAAPPYAAFRCTAVPWLLFGWRGRHLLREQVADDQQAVPYPGERPAAQHVGHPVGGQVEPRQPDHERDQGGARGQQRPGPSRAPRHQHEREHAPGGEGLGRVLGGIGRAVDHGQPVGDGRPGPADQPFDQQRSRPRAGQRQCGQDRWQPAAAPPPQAQAGDDGDRPEHEGRAEPGEHLGQAGEPGRAVTGEKRQDPRIGVGQAECDGRR